MPTLKEIKGRIASVQSTLKITSAMKLVSSAKLRKAQAAIESMRPYSDRLQGILSRLLSAPGVSGLPGYGTAGETDAVVIVAISSNSSLCGAFNANVIRRVKQLLAEYPGATVYSIGRKVADALRKAGYPSPEDLNHLSEHPSYAAAASLSGRFREAFSQGKVGKVLLVYNHFFSTARQSTVTETFLPASLDPAEAAPEETDYILEPDPAALLAELYPKVVDLRLYTALLDSAAAEHAARTVAMQMATDNGEQLLQELTLLYNKSRQQKITSEILDLAAGAAQ
jgi:F-type H+-transporting ATPase subunit gamma